MTRSLKINFGCGVHAPKAWLNLDGSARLLAERLPFFGATGLRRHFPENVRHLRVGGILPFADNSTSHIYSSHMIEHLPKKQLEIFLRECFRILQSSGRIRLMTPSLRLVVDDYVTKRADSSRAAVAADEFMRDLGMTPENIPGTLFSTFTETLRRKNWHQWLYDETSLAARLLSAGFGDVVVRENWVSDFPDLSDLEPATLRGGSLCAEARKP